MPRRADLYPVIASKLQRSDALSALVGIAPIAVLGILHPDLMWILVVIALGVIVALLAAAFAITRARRVKQ